MDELKQKAEAAEALATRAEVRAKDIQDTFGQLSSGAVSVGDIGHGIIGEIVGEIRNIAGWVRHLGHPTAPAPAVTPGMAIPVAPAPVALPEDQPVTVTVESGIKQAQDLIAALKTLPQDDRNAVLRAVVHDFDSLFVSGLNLYNADIEADQEQEGLQGIPVTPPNEIGKEDLNSIPVSNIVTPLPTTDPTGNPIESEISEETAKRDDVITDEQATSAVTSDTAANPVTDAPPADLTPSASDPTPPSEGDATTVETNTDAPEDEAKVETPEGGEVKSSSPAGN